MADTSFLDDALSDVGEFVQNVEDISGEVTAVLTALSAFATAMAAFGDTAYPYIVKAFKATVELLEQLGTEYEEIIAKLNEMASNIEALAVQHGYEVLGYDDDYFAKVAEMAEKQEAAEDEV